MKQVYEKILSVYRKTDLNLIYQWKIPDDCPIDINIKGSNYNKNVFLKNNLRNIITDDNYLDIAYWIVQKWGRIANLKRNKSNNLKLNNLRQTWGEDKLTLDKSESDVISSLSKVASFLFPEKYCIFDSRVSFSINWFIFLYGDESKFFNQPIGRGEILNYDQLTIFNLKKKKYTFYNKKSCFIEYNIFIKKLMEYFKSKKCMVNNYDLEMFFFAIADKYVIDDIKDKIKLTIVST